MLFTDFVEKLPLMLFQLYHKPNIGNGKEIIFLVNFGFTMQTSPLLQKVLGYVEKQKKGQ